jgi:hypothetical protein
MHHRRRYLPSLCGPSGHEGQSGDLPVPAQGVYAHAKALRPRRVRRTLALAPPSVWPSTRPPVSALWINRFRGAIPRLRAPLPTSRLPPHGDLRTARGRCGSLDLHRSGLAPPTPCQSPGKSGRSVTAACVHTTVGGLQVSHGSCLSCSSAAEVPRITAAAWESHTGETARTRVSTVLSLASGAV